MFGHNNSRRQGDIGVSEAIRHFTRDGYLVFVPLCEHPRVDLIVEKDGALFRVQVKTTRHLRPTGNYEVHLRTNGGNRSGSGRSKNFSKADVDVLFVAVGDGSLYRIPANEIRGQQAITLCDRYTKFKV